MADIRLKKITVEPSQTLIIQNGNINISNTNISNSRFNGSLIINGGLGINCTYDSTSSTNGGALTIGGGLSVWSQTFLGNNLIMDNSDSTLSINGLGIPRLFLDSVSNKYFYISPDGASKKFELSNTKLNINITTQSTNLTSGALIINGGISINSTTDATNSSNGGSLTIGGGMAIGGRCFLSKNITIGELYSNQYGLLVRYTGDSQIALQNSSGSYNTTFNMENNSLVIASNNDILFKTTTGNFVFSNSSTNNTLLTIADKSSTFHKFVNITDTIASLNLTTASLIIQGGISIQCTRDAISITNGGAITINGGVGITKKTYIGDSLGLELSNSTKTNKFLLFQQQQSVTEENLFTGLGVTSGSLRFQVYDTNRDFTFFSSSTSGTSSEVFRIKGTNEVQFIGANQRYSFLAGGNTSNDLSIQSQSLAESSSICFFTKDGDTNDNNDLKIFGLGLPNNVTNSEYLRLGWDTNKYILSTNRSGTGSSKELIIQTHDNLNQCRLLTDGSIFMSSTKSSTNSTTAGLVLMGGISIQNTNDATSLTTGGALTLQGGISVSKSAYIGNKLHIISTAGNISLYARNSSGDLIISNPTNNYVLSNNTTTGPSTSSLNLFCLNNVKSNNYEIFEIISNSTSTNSSYNIHTEAGGSGILKPLQIHVGNNTHIFLHTNGNIGLNTTNPSYQLDINGSVNANNYNYFNQLTIYNTSPAISSSTSGCLTVLGGTSISKNMFVGGIATFNNTTNSSSTSASVYITGGLTIATNQSSNWSSGALTVNGGGYIAGDLYVRQTLNLNAQLNGKSINAESLILTSTTNALNLTTGSLLTYGGITINTSTNATNLSNGGSFLTPGGASIGKDLYIGGNLYNYGIQNFYYNTNSLINFFDTFNLTRFSIDRNVTSNDLSISRYNSSGVFVEKSIDISNSNGQITFNNSTNSTGITTGALITVGGITIRTTAQASSVQNGGGLTIFGGTSIAKNLYVGGDVILSSTTNSSNSNEGALRVSGGVGINGNVNILGNTVINGNLSIIGTTNSIFSTNTLISDNVLVLNSGPAGSFDAGILIQRYQVANNTGTGDVVNDLTDQHESYTLPNQSGMTTTQLKLPTSASSIDNYYVGWWIKITSGFSVNQVRKVTGYIGSSRTLTIETIWNSQNPTLGDTVQLYNRPYVGLFWNETIDTFQLGTTINDSVGSVTLTEYASLYLSNLTIQDTIPSTNSSTGSLISKGGISIPCSIDSTSVTNGGALTIAGGSSIAKSLYVGNKMYVNGVDITPNIYDQFATMTFTAANNVTSQSIPSINYSGSSVWGFDVYLAARLTATTNLYANYHIKAVNKQTSWELITNYVGDSILSFNITNDGQLQYSTQNFSGFSSLIFKYKVFTN